MARIVIIGGTGYSGGHILREAVKRGHDVTSVSRSLPQDPVDGAVYEIGSITDAADRARALRDADDVIVAISPRGDMTDAVRPAIAAFSKEAAEAGVRFGVIGGAGSSFVAEGGPLLKDTPEFPDAVKPEATAMGEVLDDLRRSPESLDWFLVSPAATYGSFVSVESRGTYRTDGDVLVAEADGTSSLSGADLALAVLDEIEKPAHRRARFTVGY
ncbi:NAD(P)-dependent oxidoreductase [Agromyces archimandritae]|uniref:NAD(P)H-binding protein n=1 Tax=Agromyces archimandritae TaxID=2781962 RepID=A0A975FPU9_9MICO|nr:NAD(P)H-binding protein [Agromyces archimandritae]QTX05612.1 NAD(P)H-binding protein [Agromyces archimandritae]